MSRKIYVYKISDVRETIDKINSRRRGVNLITWIPGIKVKDSWFMCPCEQKDDNPQVYCNGIVSINNVNPEEREVIIIPLISIHDKQRTYIPAREKSSLEMAEKLSLSCKPVTILLPESV